MTFKPPHQALEIGARIAGEPSARLIASAFQSELDQQLPLADALGKVDLAHTLVLAESGVIPPEAAQELLAGLNQLRLQPETFFPDPGKGDLYTNREAWLKERTPAAAWLGAGRARREAITTAFLIKLREDTLVLTQSLAEFVRTLTNQAEDHADALMPDYTYWQQAQPTSFGHYLLGFAYPALRDLQRIADVYPRLNQSPAGCGSSNGSRLPQPRECLAHRLGFDGIVPHARDAMWQADLPIEIASVLTAILINLDRLAEDLQIFASEEFALVELDDGHARASKIMPQKKNPFALTHIRSLANSLIGTLTSCAAMGRTPSGQPDNRLTLYGTLPKALSETNLAVALMSEVIALLRFNRNYARAKLDRGFSLAADLAEVLTLDHGIAFRDAHRLVGQLVRQHLPDGGFQQLTAAEINSHAKSLLGLRINLTDAALKQALNPEAALAARNQPGGAAPAAITEMINQCRHALLETETWQRECLKRLQTAENNLEQALQTIINT